MEEEVDTKLEGLEAFAHMIESVLSRVTCSFSNTAIRLQSRDTSIGVRLELVIDKLVKLLALIILVIKSKILNRYFFKAGNKFKFQI